MAESMYGDWTGTLRANGNELQLVLHINKNDSVTLDSVSQGVNGIVGKFVEISDETLDIKFPGIIASYKGKRDGTKIEGEFNQSGKSYPLVFEPVITPIKMLARPQTPLPPYDYQIKSIRFQNPTDEVSLAGSLTLPQNSSPKAVLILLSGSGPQNRDEELFGHKPFWVMADYFTRQGFAVLRFDDRGVGESEGSFVSASLNTFVLDAIGAVAYIKRDATLKGVPVGLIGHSEGALVAGIAAQRAPAVKFVVMLAAPAIPGDRIYKQQIDTMLTMKKYEPKKIKSKLYYINEVTTTLKQRKSGDLDKQLAPVIEKLVLLDSEDGTFSPELAQQYSAIYTRPSFQDFIRSNPEYLLKDIDVPVFALTGEKDRQVSSQENLQALQHIFNKNGKANLLTTRELKKLNHLFQNSQTGLPEEYGVIEETFSVDALNEIRSWMQKIIGTLQ